MSAVNTKNGLTRSYFFSHILDDGFGATTPFENDLIRNKIIKSGLSLNYFVFEDIALLSFSADVLDKDRFLESVEDRLKKPLLNKKLFDLDKKSYLASIIRAYDDPELVTNAIQRDIIRYGGFIKNAYEIISNYSFDEYKESYNKLDFSNRSIIYIDYKRK